MTDDTPRITLIAALTPERVIGAGNDLPWRIPDDLRHFKATTRGKPVIMGRRNFESIGRPLPERHNIVVSTRPDFRAEGCTVVRTPKAALQEAGAVPEVMVIGGGVIYAEFLPHAHRLELTWVEATIDGDTWFPDFDAADWQVVAEQRQAAGPGTPYPLLYQTLDRIC